MTFNWYLQILPIISRLCCDTICQVLEHQLAEQPVGELPSWYNWLKCWLRTTHELDEIETAVKGHAVRITRRSDNSDIVYWAYRPCRRRQCRMVPLCNKLVVRLFRHVELRFVQYPPVHYV